MANQLKKILRNIISEEIKDQIRQKLEKEKALAQSKKQKTAHLAKKQVARWR